MTHTSKTLVFFGNERLSTGFTPNGAPTLQALIKAGYTVKAVIAHNNTTASRTKRDLEIETVANRHGIPILLPEKPANISSELINFKADAAILTAYGKIIPQSIIDIFPLGIINIHPSLLPLYRGPTPIEQTIRDGAKKTGVSLMKLSAGMDSGPVYVRQEVVLTGGETKDELTRRLLEVGSKLLITHLPAILEKSLTPQAQNEADATYTKLLTKEDGILDLNEPAEAIERTIQAYATWPKSRLVYNGVTLIITLSRVAATKTDGILVVECGGNTFLEITELIGPSGKKMSGAAYLRGHAH